MNLRYPSSDTPISADQSAAEWALRHDRGLTAAEQDEFSAWLAADARHRAAWSEHRWGWDELDRLAGLQTSEHALPDPELLAPRRGLFREHWRSAVMLAAMATIAALLWWPRPVPTIVVPPVGAATPPSLALIEQRQLPDGSVIELNRGAVLTEQFTAGERRVRLDRGEAHFTVAKDSARPFVVEAGGVAVRAVGTAFNIRLDPASVEVLVTEGRVGIAAPEAQGAGDRVQGGGDVAANPAGSVQRSVLQDFSLFHLNAGERTVVSLAPSAPPPQVTAVTPAELEARLAWQPRLLDFTNAPLAEIVAEFNRRNPVRLVLDGAALAELRLSATFRSDNVEGFVRLMESDFGMRAEWRGDGEIVLFSASPKTR